MYFQRKSLEDLIQENTKVWACDKEDCNGWIRDNFSFETVPTCHLCLSPMISSLKMLPIISNSNKNMKSLQKGRLIS
ncbi:cold-shock protein [Paenibacillus chondroitinus]|uniref:Cold-shock protein n=1 Tax=Paenibacillus chondroitinus TaxID=59842 RepID=A0ABU6DB70_9BACL|nr:MULTISPECIES: cold-shock protein [Paenibacillus]MCY9662316.1 cold-shock protein [Paenibacillus anseongense]MEB4794645.1 cold-shock protein [Paenibacillus chondroitinus]